MLRQCLQCLIIIQKMLGFDLALTSKYKHFQNDFEDLGKIGTGGFARVHRVRSKLDNRQYALKILEIKPSQCKQDIIQTIHKFLQEVKVLSFLNHKNVIQYYGCWVQAEFNDVSDIVQLNQDEQFEESNEIVMVMEEDYSSGGIEFACSSNNSDAKTNQKNRNSSTIFQKQSLKLQIPIDHSEAASKIRATYKSIKIYILSQLCQGNVQSFLYQRNLAKNHAKKLKSSTKGQNSSTGSKIPSTNKQKKDQLMQNYKMIIQIIQGLEYLHSKKIIHRDIKLHNIVFDKNKKCKIIDYGLAKKARMLQSISEYPRDMSSASQHDDLSDQVFSSSVGTRIYSSPQQITSQRYDHRTDIFSLAIVILMFFCQFTTTHQQLSIIQRIRKSDLQFIKCDQRLKVIMAKCLGQQKNRPRLSQVRKVVKTLLRQRYQRQSKKLPQNSSPINQYQNAVQKQQNIYIVENCKLKKKMSKEEYLFSNNNTNCSTLKEKETSSSSNTIKEEDIFDEIQKIDQEIKEIVDMGINLNLNGEEDVDVKV